MKPWEIERTNRKISKLSGQRTVKLFFDLYKAAIEVLRASILSERPKLSPKHLKIKMGKLSKSIGSL